MKKRFKVLFSLLLCCSSLSAVETELRFMPAMNLAAGSVYDSVPSLGLSLDIIPVNVRGIDDLTFSLQGTAAFLNANGIESLNLFDGSFASGYNFRFMDRFSIGAELSIGLWNVPSNETNKTSAASGISVGGRAYGSFYVFPELEVGASFGYKQFMYKPKPFMNDFEIGLYAKYNFTRGFSVTSKLITTGAETSPVFPVFYSHYDENSFGRISFLNDEKTAIQDVEISIFIEQYMTNPKVIGEFDRIERGQEFNVALTAFLNENILDLLQNQLADAQIIVTYTTLGKRISHEENLELQVLNRNSMSWEDDRRAAAFVSGRDGTIRRFTKQLKVMLNGEMYNDIPVNIQYAAAIFGLLKTYGINYVIDPSSAFTDNIGTASIDFLQFPYQTIIYHGGDCDDLSILNCALLEALGISTAFITVPGHIYMAFDSGLSPSQAGSHLAAGRYIVQDNKVWIPVEITVTQDTFDLAWQLGIVEWKKYGNESQLIPLSGAWELYKPVSIAGSDTDIAVPPKDTLLRAFWSSVKSVRGKYTW